MAYLLPRLAVTAAVAFAACVAAHAADPRFPDWPCVQAKVPELSVAAMWAGPPLDDVDKIREGEPAVKDLVPRLAPRRVPIEDAQKIIAEFIVGSVVERQHKGMFLFAGL